MGGDAKKPRIRPVHPKWRYNMKSMYLKHLIEEAEVFFIFQGSLQTEPITCAGLILFSGGCLGTSKGLTGRDELFNIKISQILRNFQRLQYPTTVSTCNWEIYCTWLKDYDTLWFCQISNHPLPFLFISTKTNAKPRYTNKCTPRGQVTVCPLPHPKWMEWNAKIDKTNANMGFYMFMPVWKSISQLLEVFAQRQSRASEACSAKSAAATPWKGGKLSSVFQ